jgi:hypothetical protein
VLRRRVCIVVVVCQQVEGQVKTWMGIFVLWKVVNIVRVVVVGNAMRRHESHEQRSALNG